jgi:hypothetical protein
VCSTGTRQFNREAEPTKPRAGGNTIIWVDFQTRCTLPEFIEMVLEGIREIQVGC